MLGFLPSGKLPGAKNSDVSIFWSMRNTERSTFKYLNIFHHGISNYINSPKQIPVELWRLCINSAQIQYICLFVAMYLYNAPFFK